MLAADRRLGLVDVNQLGRHGQDRLLRNADDFEPVADGDVVDVGKRPRNRDLIVGERPVSARDAQLLDIPARVVAPDGGHHVLVPGQLQLHVGGVVWTAICRRSNERWRPGEGAGLRP